MPPDPHEPDAFDVYTVVVLRRPADAPEMSDEDLDVLQSRHLAYRADLGRQWWVRAGPLAFPLTERPVGDRRSMPDD